MKKYTSSDLIARYPKLKRKPKNYFKNNLLSD